MPSDRILIEIVTAAHMAGVKEAQAGFLGLNPLILAVGAGLGLVVEMGKSEIKNAEEQQAALRNLSQAYHTLGEKVPTKVIEDFISKNDRFVGSMYEAENGFAQLARAGFKYSMQYRLMNDALDLAAVKHSTLTEAVTMLIKAHGGSSRALLDLGISQKEVNALVGKGGTTTQKYAELLKLLEPRLKGARDTTSEMAQNSSRLSVQWQKISNENGPALEGMVSTVTGKFADFLSTLRNSDSPGGPWAHFQTGLIYWIGLAKDAVGWMGALGSSFDALMNRLPGSNNYTPPGHIVGGGRAGAQRPPPTQPQIVLHNPTIVTTDVHAKQMMDAIRRVNRSFQ